MIAFQVKLDSESEELRKRDATLRSTNDGPINKNRANTEIEALVKSEKRQASLLSEIDRKTKAISDLGAERAAQVGVIEEALAERAAAQEHPATVFASQSRELPGMTFRSSKSLVRRNASSCLSVSIGELVDAL